MQGLGNLGNTCYINSFIQCIGHVECLRDWVIETNHTGEFTKELQDVLERMWMQQQSLLPKRFVRCIQTTFDFGMFQQHDISELIMMCYDKIATEDKSPPHSFENIAHVDAKNNSIQTLCKKAIDVWKKYHPSGFRRWHMLTEGLQVQQVQCMTCKACLHNFEPITMINIDLSDNDVSVDLNDKIESFFDIEHLQEWKCDHCKSVQPCEKVVRIWKLPRALGIVLKRFRYCPQLERYVKIRTSVRLPHVLEFKQPHVLTGETLTYKLRSVALHHGSMDGGHYTCMGVHENAWYHYDDINVSKISNNLPDPYDSKEAYILMYERA